MKSRLLVFAIISFFVVSPLAHAEGPTMTMLTEDQLKLVRENCQNSKTILRQIHANDALIRVNLGREYDTISTKYMAPMNSRVALDKLNGIDLTSTTVNFDQQVATFKSAYQQYEQSLTKATQTDCSQPVDYYTAIEQARFYRAEVRKSVVELERLAGQYSNQLDKLDLSKESTSGDSND